MKKVNILRGLIVLLVLLLIVSIVLIYLQSPALSTLEALNNNNINDATCYYYQTKGHPIHELIYSFHITGTLDKINQKYNSDNFSYENVLKLYETINSFSTESVVDTYYSDFLALHDSKEAYDRGEQAFFEQDYAKAIKNYKEVIETDTLYDNAQKNIDSLTEEYISKTKEDFYSYIMEDEYNLALNVIDTALEIVNDYELKNMKDNLSGDVYRKCRTLLNNIETWQLVKQAHAGENIYYCYRISVDEQNPNYIHCLYVPKSIYKQVRDGHIDQISAVSVWYYIDKEYIAKTSYDQEKNLKRGNSITWNFYDSSSEKFYQLENLFS